MTNAGAAAAAGLVPGARLVSLVIQRPYAGECVLSRKPNVGSTGVLFERSGDALGKAVQTRGCAYGWCRACDPDERDDSDGLLYGRMHAGLRLIPFASRAESLVGSEAVIRSSSGKSSFLCQRIGGEHSRCALAHGGFHCVVWFSVRLWNWRGRTRNVVRTPPGDCRKPGRFAKRRSFLTGRFAELRVGWLSISARCRDRR